MGKRILIVGSGGREHALAWKLKQSPRVSHIYVAPGNGGTLTCAENIPLTFHDTEELIRFAREKRIDLAVIGLDDALAAGLTDSFTEAGVRVFGPTQAAARIESSKVFAKLLMLENGVPTAPLYSFGSYERALAFLQRMGAPIVVKADGLALGKGVYVCHTLGDAEQALHKIMVERVHGSAGDTVILEELLIGPELSAHAWCDGTRAALFPFSRDYKPVFDGNLGPNTGGMGAYAPIPNPPAHFSRIIQEKILMRTLDGMLDYGLPFVGCLYPGLIQTSRGLQVLEFNARPGDPETQVYMRLLKTDLLDILEACVDGDLNSLSIEWYPRYAVCVVLASAGYPGPYEKDKAILGLPAARQLDDVVIFHAGTTYADRLRTNGGRVLSVTATGSTLEAARQKAYEAVRLIHFDGMQYRTDIAL